MKPTTLVDVRMEEWRYNLKMANVSVGAVVRELGVERLLLKAIASQHTTGIFSVFSLTQQQRNRLDDLRRKRATVELIAARNRNGHIYVYVWQMDCDCASWDSMYCMPATYEAFDKFCDGIYENAEGRVSIHISTQEEYRKFRPSSRDHALEAFEDGHPHSVHVGMGIGPDAILEDEHGNLSFVDFKTGQLGEPQW